MNPAYLKLAPVTLLLYYDSSLETSFDSLRHLGCVYFRVIIVTEFALPVIVKGACGG